VRVKVIGLLIMSIFGGVVLMGLICPNTVICFRYYLRFTRCCPQTHSYLIGILAYFSRSPQLRESDKVFELHSGDSGFISPPGHQTR